jgi:hypothetical protein
LTLFSGQIVTLDNYIVGRRQVCAFLQQIDQSYPNAEKIYVVMDNWSIHQHDDVQAQLKLLPRLEVVWLPTYARLSQSHRKALTQISARAPALASFC